MAKGKVIILGGLVLALLAAGGASAADKTDVILPPIPDGEDDQLIRTMCACVFELLEQSDAAPFESVIQCALAELFPQVLWPPREDSHQSHHDWWAYAVSVIPQVSEFCAQFPPPPVPNGDGDQDFDEPPLYQPSDTDCHRDNQPYNVAQFPDPAAAASAFIELGFPVTITELYRSDAVANTPIWQASEGYDPQPSESLEAFQNAAIMMQLPGHEGAGAGARDGVIGECTLRSASEALSLKSRGDWPYGAPGRAKAGFVG